MFWRILRWVLASCVFLLLMAAIYYSAKPEEIIFTLDLENESQISIHDLSRKIVGVKEVFIIYKENGKERIIDKRKLLSGKLFSLIDQAEIQEGSQGKELVVKTKTWWLSSIGASIVCLIFSVGISMLSKDYIR